MPHDWREIDIETVERHMTKDLISRAEAIAEIRKQIGKGDEPWMNGNNSAIAACVATIRALPTYEVVVKPLSDDVAAKITSLIKWLRENPDNIYLLPADDVQEFLALTSRRSALTATTAADVAGLVDAAEEVVAKVNQPDATWDLPFRTVRRLTVALARMKEAGE